MLFRRPGFKIAGLVVAIQLCSLDLARGGVITTSPTLPILGAGYVSLGSDGCFAADAVCVMNGSLTLAPPVSVSFNSSGEDILSNAVFTGQITTSGGAPLGTATLFGTVQQEVTGRFTATATGSWTTDLTGLALSGPALGDTLTLSLDSSSPSSGTTSIVPSGQAYLINSFFDVFVDLNLNSSPPEVTSRGPILFQAVPEPISLFVLAPASLMLLVFRRRGLMRAWG
jgi:hypothetical protein